MVTLAKPEALWFDLGNVFLRATNPNFDGALDVDQKVEGVIARAGVGYKFLTRPRRPHNRVRHPLGRLVLLEEVARQSRVGVGVADLVGLAARTCTSPPCPPLRRIPACA
jgi:hypothetical protein